MKLPCTPSFRLDQSKALVTGASSGIGLACAVALAEAGAEVTIAARRLDALKALQKEMLEKGWKVSVLQLDMEDLDAMKMAFTDLPAFDVVVNSAGTARHSEALKTTVEDYDAVMNLNLRAAYFLATEAAAKMIQNNKKGSIINISSQMGHVGGFNRAVYCASKHAVEGMTKSMAIEWGSHGIRINTVCPTFIRTPLAQSTFDDPKMSEWINSKIKLGRVGEVEDIMGAVIFLACDASAMVTGTALMVDGGWTIG